MAGTPQDLLMRRKVSSGGTPERLSDRRTIPVGGLDKPTFMGVATKDTIIPPQMEKDQAKAAKATSIEVPSSHVAMLSFPKEVAQLILKAAE